MVMRIVVLATMIMMMEVVGTRPMGLPMLVDFSRSSPGRMTSLSTPPCVNTLGTEVRSRRSFM